jgi:catechol 2,3-dioxygenase-like lactoylglutathione lyase family enzyme
MDHIVLNVADAERSVAFYRDVLGLAIERLEEWRAGKVGFPSARVSEGTMPLQEC